MTESIDPNIHSLELVAHALGDLLQELVLVGGCAVGLLITDKARPAVRQTIDVDLVTEVTPIANYYEFCDKLRKQGFREAEGEVICRWTKGALIVDIMPSDEKVLGFTNQWYPLVLQTSQTSKLPSGIGIRHVTAPLFVATKLVSFYDRGQGDYMHHDVEDIINVVDGRPELVSEILASPTKVREFIQDEVDALLGDQSFTDSITRHLRPGQFEQARAPIILERLRALAGL